MQIETPPTYECFCDESYYGYWAVRKVGEQRWGYCFHLVSQSEAEGLCRELNALCADRARLLEGQAAGGEG